MRLTPTARITVFLSTLLLILTSACSKTTITTPKETANWQWQTLQVKDAPVARHEAGFIAFEQKLYLIGGRRINPTSRFDPVRNQWQNLNKTPIELHHFQPVVFNNKIYIIGAMTGPWPKETPVSQVIIYDPKTDQYEMSHTIPEHRRRGGAGAVVYNNKIYIIGGVTNGHLSGNQAWLDEYDPITGQWRVLPDAPNARDHFHAAVANDKLYAFAGRLTRESAPAFGLTNNHGNIYDFKSNSWRAVTEQLEIPTKRAGNAAFAWHDSIVIVGGESDSQIKGHNEVESFHTISTTWQTWPTLNRGRHGSGIAIVDGYAYIASGSGNRGGGPELTSIERLKLPLKNELKIVSSNIEPASATSISAAKNENQRQVIQQFHPITLNFLGPSTSETDVNNPFLNYKLWVEFSHKESGDKIKVPGYFAADGDAANSSANIGNVWQVKFSPQLQGEWQYSATLFQGNNVAVIEDYTKANKVNITNLHGSFLVSESDKEGADFRAHGKLIAKDGYFIFEHNQKHWLKGGANSPENLLGYADFDGTYRVSVDEREGEAKANDQLHKFAAHLKDWKTGDLTWKDGKGKSLVGAINYLAEQDMNAVYFLTMNITGDGNDVWPYIDHQNLARFDTSKLAQWDLLFSYMQSKGILLHIVLQETENERLLDGGNTEKLRKLYYNELIARFGYHNALVWNLGEENGPAKWSPVAQNDDQRKAMISYLAKADPYNHPIIIHTHSYEPVRSQIIEPLLGIAELDGLSFQANKRKEVPELMRLWREKSKAHGKEWLITMDEIGEWHTGATTDAEYPAHNSLRQYALWGAIMSGAAGVEWYFGAKSPHNDLTSEDWRQRHNLWQQTRIALQFFNQHTKYWQFSACENFDKSRGFCAKQQSEDQIKDQQASYLAYFFAQNPDSDPSKSIALNLANNDSQYQILWFNPLTGGELQLGSITKVNGGEQVDIGSPSGSIDGDWVALITPIIP